MSTQRHDEEFAKQAFDTYLHQRTAQVIQWTNGNQNVPPDFYLSVGEETFVVEVTNLMLHVELSDKKVFPVETLYEWCNKFVSGIDAEVRRSGKLKGTYYISFTSEFEELKNYSKKLRKKIIKIIEKTLEKEQFESIDITIDYIRFCSICKFINPDDEVRFGGRPRISKWQGVAEREALENFRDSLVKKTVKLKPFTHEKILLLIARNVFVPANRYFDFLVDLDLSEFHTVFIVSGFDNNQSYVLYTKNNDWA
jgi:hypothetical protein